MFKNLFSFKSNKDPEELLQLATQKKKEGNLDEAIMHLKDAYKILKRSKEGRDIKTFLRLPKYLQLANRSDEAWSEFNRLISDVYSKQSNNIVIQHINASIIYDSMRLFLQREKKYKQALIFFTLSYLKQIESLSAQQRKEELENLRTEKYIAETLIPHLKKAGIEGEKDTFIKILIDESKNSEKIKVHRATKKIKSLLNSA